MTGSPHPCRPGHGMPGTCPGLTKWDFAELPLASVPGPRCLRPMPPAPARSKTWSWPEVRSWMGIVPRVPTVTSTCTLVSGTRGRRPPALFGSPRSPRLAPPSPVPGAFSIGHTCTAAPSLPWPGLCVAAAWSATALLGPKPVREWGLLPRAVICGGEWSRLLTAPLVHGKRGGWWWQWVMAQHWVV